MQTINLVRQHKVNGETLTYTETILCNTLVAVDIPVLGGVRRQPQPVALTASLLQSVYVAANQACTVHVNGTSAVQTLTVSGSPTGGTFTISGSNPAAWTTAAIAYNATAAQVASAVQSAILAVSGGAGTTIVGTGGPLPGSPVALAFGGTLALQPITLLTVNTSGLTGGTPSGSLAATTAGVAPAQTFVLVAGQAIDWTVNSPEGCPVTVDVAQLSVTNPGTGSVVVQCRFGSN